MDTIELISLGPWCHSALMLKEAGLRRCSYPFDWCQSGSIQHSDIMRLSPTEFYFRHIHNPSILFEHQQTEEINEHGHTNGIPVQLRPLYGYQMFWNPHRQQGQEMDYFLRCLQRLQECCRDPNIYKVFFLADFRNKPYHIFLDPEHDVFDFIAREVGVYIRGKWALAMQRTSVVEHELLPRTVVTKREERFYYISEYLPSPYESKENSEGQNITRQKLVRHRDYVLRNLVMHISGS
jgi:hypothetical protein